MKKLKGAISPTSNIFKSGVFLLAVVVLLFSGTLAVQEVSAENTAAEQLVNSSATAENQLAYVDQSDIVFSSFDHLANVGNLRLISPKIEAEYFQPVNNHWFCNDVLNVPIPADPNLLEQTSTGGKGGQQVPPIKGSCKVGF